MQTYQPYYPQMNNFNQQYNPQQPYMERLAGLQQFQQSLQAQQPQQPQQQFQQMPMGISGRVVPNAEAIAANDVPMDGSVAFFPISDVSKRNWQKQSGANLTKALRMSIQQRWEKLLIC